MAKQSISYEPQVLDLSLYAGDGITFRVLVKDIDGAPMNLSGSMRAHIRVTRDSQGNPDASFQIDLVDAAEGIAVLSLTGEQTQELAPEKKYTGVWDLEWTAIDVEPMTLCQGSVGCSPDVSH